MRTYKSTVHVLLPALLLCAPVVGGSLRRRGTQNQYNRGSVQTNGKVKNKDGDTINSDGYQNSLNIQSRQRNLVDEEDAAAAAADDMINPPVYYDDDGTDVLSYFESSHRRLNATDASLSYLIDHTKLSEYDASQWCVFLLVVMVAPVVAGITCAIFHTNTFY